MTLKAKWKEHEQVYLLKKLGEMLEKGYTLSEAFELVMFYQPLKQKEQLRKCLAKLSQGKSLSSSFKGLHFRDSILSYLFFAEKYGNLEFGLKQSSQLLLKQIELKQKVLKLLRYPIFLMMIVCLMIYFIQSFLFPQFSNLYASMSIPLPPMTKVMFIFPKYLPYLFLFICTVGIGFFIYYFFHFRYLSASLRMKRLLKIPLFNHLIKKLLTYYFSFQLGALLKGGLSIIDSLSVFKEQNHLPFFKEEAAQLSIKLKEGERFTNIIEERVFYDHELAVVINHGQANGLLFKELENYSEFLLEQIEMKLHRFLTFIQPIVFLGVGGLITFMYLSIMIPIFNMINTL